MIDILIKRRKTNVQLGTTKWLNRLAFAALSLSLGVTTALAMPKMRANIEVTGSLVTLSDLFEDAGPQGSRAVFRAPSIGQSGVIRAERVLLAARDAGLNEVDRNNVTMVRVRHASQLVTEHDITDGLLARMKQKGFVSSAGDVELSLNQNVPDQHASLDALQSFHIRALRFDRSSGRFSANILIGGRNDLSPIRISGQATETVMVPIATRNILRGDLIMEGDIILSPMPRQRTRGIDRMQISNLIGKAARQNIRQGAIASNSMFKVPEIINRSDIVTILFKSGNLTLTMRGTAMTAGAKGDVIAIQNLQTNRIIRARVKDAGLVQVGETPMTIAAVKGQTQ
ncbi:MAG: flagellar basal body P-ring formation chaperone FlgA [Cohaesibacter sp.]|nr:flagellar basal body P-ring formation chaperone FlgA [Cohaesibacter sp.]